MPIVKLFKGARFGLLEGFQRWPFGHEVSGQATGQVVVAQLDGLGKIFLEASPALAPLK